jgi:hypothetical protein
MLPGVGSRPWWQQTHPPQVMKWLLIECSESATESTKYWPAQLESQPPQLRHFVHIAKARGRIEQDHRELQAELGRTITTAAIG